MSPRTVPAGTPLGDDFHVFDTTLRDGAQREGISYSVADKLAVARLLDELGVGFIEGGWPGALPKDTEFFARARTELNCSTPCWSRSAPPARPGVRVEDDPQVRALLDAQDAGGCLVAKSDVRHVERALRTTLEENLAMVADTVAFLRARRPAGVRRLRALLRRLPARPGLRRCGCWTRPSRPAPRSASCATPTAACCPIGRRRVVAEVRDRTGVRLGIHCQDDTGCAVANTVAAVEAGVTHVQCTANGYGERAGNADLFAVVGNLVTKLGLPVLPDGAWRS